MAASSTRSKTTAKKATSKAKPAKAASAKGKVSAKSKVSAKVPAKKATAKKVAAKPAKAEPVAAKKVAKAVKAEAVAEPKVAKKPLKPVPPVEVAAPEVVEPVEPKVAKKPARPPARPSEPAGEHELTIVLPPPPPPVDLTPVERKKSVLEIAEEDDDYSDEPPIPTLDNLAALLDRIHQIAQFGSEIAVREELPPLVELLEQIEDPAALPRLLDLLEDTDPHGVYWNVLYVLEKFDVYLRVLLDGLPALYHRAPEWAYTCVIRILRTRGDEDDCTAAFEQLICAGPADTRALMVRILRELSAHPDTDEDQRQNIARTIAAIGGDVVAPPAASSRAPGLDDEPAPEAAS